MILDGMEKVEEVEEKEKNYHAVEKEQKVNE